MSRRFLSFFGVILLILSVNIGSAADWMWARGNLHTHTTNSDGDSPLQAVADWYRTNGYQFLVITDHAKATDVSAANAGQGFVLVPGEELESRGEWPPIHSNAIGISKVLPIGEKQVTHARSLQKMVGSIQDAGALPMVNHPNWYFSLSHRELSQIHGPYILEIANMYGAGNNNAGSLAKLSNEQTWDVLLSEGETVYAAAADDMHILGAKPDKDAGPGKGWVVARVSELTPQAVVGALSKGEFYTSTGVELADYSFDGKEFRISVTPKENATYLIRFVGKNGRILQETTGASAKYRFTEKPEKNAYIRCKVIASDQTIAWTQAYRINP